MNLIVQPQATDVVIQLSLLELSHLSPVPFETAPTAESFELRDYQKQVIKQLYQQYLLVKKSGMIFTQGISRVSAMPPAQNWE